MYICFLFHNKSNEITSLWPVFYYMLYTYINVYINSLFHRDETKPTHIIGINSFLLLMQLIYKHSSPNYQHMINYWKLINKMLVYIRVHKSKHFQPHSLLCHLWCLLFAMHSFLYDIFIYDHFKSWRSSFDKLFFFSYTIHISHC